MEKKQDLQKRLKYKVDGIQHPTNGDEERYHNKIASFTKSLPHNKIGEVSPNAFTSFIKALDNGKPKAFENIKLGGLARLVNPQAAFATDFLGLDPAYFSIPAPPAFSSAWQASEMAENYWRSLTRDIPFQNYDTNKLIKKAAKDLSLFSDYRGPMQGRKVIIDTLFRGDTKGDLIGPFVSQFLWKDIPFGATTVPQKYKLPIKSQDYLTTYANWLAIQNGNLPTTRSVKLVSRYIYNYNGLCQYVHKDFPDQTFLSASLQLLSYGNEALDDSNPYLTSKTQDGFITFGAEHILDLVSQATRIALKAVWFQKYLVHRRLRPEEFAGRVHNHLTGRSNYPIHEELLNSQAIRKVYKKYGTYLLPMAYPEGCPIHPSYPAGHATVAGAAVTVLKAFFKESFVIKDPVIASSDGQTLLSYKGADLTVGNELNKLASNIAHARDTAGVHWRSDGREGLRLGEAVAISILEDYKKTYNENFKGFNLTKFDGTTIKIG